MDSQQITEINGQEASCDGGGGALGHPRIYLTIGPRGEVVCPYCSRRFVQKSAAGHAPASASAH